MKKLYYLSFISLFCFACYNSDSGNLIAPEPVNYGLQKNSQSYDTYSYKDDYQAKNPDQELAPTKSISLGSHGLPWEVWRLFHDLEGNKILNPIIIEGDELTSRGRYEEAKEKYFSARSVGNSIAIREALALRLASTELALGHPENALAVLSSIIRKLGREANQVNAEYSLLLAFAYGRTRDFDQALAWFSRAHQLSPVSSTIGFATDRGLRLMMESIETHEIDLFREKWRVDTYVNGFIAREASRRAAGGRPEKNNAFWRNDIQQEAVESHQQAGPVIGNLAVLLPFSGKFAALGNAVKQGFELAIDGQSLRNRINLNYYDTAGDVAKAASIARSFESAEIKPDMVLGPLLSDTSSAAAEVLDDLRIPALTFSKQSDFKTTSNIFRLGATPRSQIESLVGASAYKGLQKYALVYPDDEQSREFAFLFKEVLARYPTQIIYEIAYRPGDSSAFIQISKEINNLNHEIDAIFFPDDLSMATKLLVVLPAHIKNKAHLLGTARWDENEELKRSKTLLHGAIFVNPFFEQSENQYIQQFRNTFSKLYGAEPNFLAAQGFDAGTLALTAMRKAFESKQKISESMLSIQSYEGLTSSVQIQENGELKRKFKVVELGQMGLQEITY